MHKFMLSVSEIPREYAGQELQVWIPSSHLAVVAVTHKGGVTRIKTQHIPITQPTQPLLNKLLKLEQAVLQALTQMTRIMKIAKGENNMIGWIKAQMTNVQVLLIAFH